MRFLTSIIIIIFLINGDRGEGINYTSQNRILSEYHGDSSVLETYKVLKKISNLLNLTIPKYTTVYGRSFSVTKGDKCIGFFVFDLTDTLNNTSQSKGAIRFLNNHIYHFAPISMSWSISYILIVEKGKIKIYNAVNCESKGSKIGDVIHYIQNESALLLAEKDIIKRVRSYRLYGQYHKVDIYSTLNCDYFVPTSSD
jgi:hypothetical protein